VGPLGPDVPTPRQRVVDAGLALAATALSWSILGGFDEGVGAGGWVVATVHTTAIAFRRVAPRASFAVGSLAGIAYVAAGWPMVGLGPAAVVAVYSLAAYSTRRDSLVGLVAVEVALPVAVLIGGSSTDLSTVVGNEIVLAAAWLLGDGTRRRRELAALYRQRAVALEEAQTELARQAVTLERVRIARELHDIVAHSMSVIAVQAGTGRLVVDDDPAQARVALEAIEHLSREAMDEMRRLLGVLRDERTDAMPLEPMPSLADLDRLVASAAAAGTTVDVKVTGTRRPLVPGAELAAYRIVQEALTNVRRHAPGATAHVELAFGDEDVNVTVANDLPASGGGPGGARVGGGPGGGLGIVGMRERAAVYGGSVEAAARPDGTFRVAARLPYGGSSS
jgi:signal transduction histidine kinase